MSNPITRAYARLTRSARRRDEVERLARLPQYLLRDMGLTLDGPAAIARQIDGAATR